MDFDKSRIFDLVMIQKGKEWNNHSMIKSNSNKVTIFFLFA